jgi:hypothetical protein
MQMTKVQTLAKLLKAANIQVSDTAEWQSYEDGEVTLSDGIYVQVGRGYLIVNKWVDNGEAIRHWPTRKDAQQILSDVREALAA